jgi:hypothetical protein
VGCKAAAIWLDRVCDQLLRWPGQTNGASTANLSNGGSAMYYLPSSRATLIVLGNQNTTFSGDDDEYF